MKSFFMKGDKTVKKFKREDVRLKPKVVSQKTSNIIFVGVLVGLIGLGSANIALNSYRLFQVDNVKPVVVSSKDSRNISNKVGLFMSDFLSAYFRKGSEVNSSLLTGYFGAGVDIKNNIFDTIESKLVGATLIEITENLATYRVSYEVKKDDNSQVMTKVMSIPYQEKDGKFYVSGLPYFEDVESYIARGVEGDYLLKTQYDNGKYEEEKAYLEAFFKAYSSGDETQLVPFSRKIEPISGFSFVSLDYTYFFEDGEELVSLAQVSFVDNVGFTHQENFTLRLVKQSGGSYYVNSFKHSHEKIKDNK